MWEGCDVLFENIFLQELSLNTVIARHVNFYGEWMYFLLVVACTISRVRLIAVSHNSVLPMYDFTASHT